LSLCSHLQRYKHGAGEKAKAKQQAKENSKKAKRRKARDIYTVWRDADDII
jgi:hypothetical protein